MILGEEVRVQNGPNCEDNSAFSAQKPHFLRYETPVRLGGGTESVITSLSSEPENEFEAH